VVGHVVSGETDVVDRRYTPMARHFAVALSLAALIALGGASAAFAGEITGNGRLLDMHGQSSCAFSGQQDLQWYTTDLDTTLRTDPTRGDPSHAQSWGQIPKAVRDSFPAFLHPGIACNPTRALGE
jgi:hypothetical protein